MFNKKTGKSKKRENKKNNEKKGIVSSATTRSRRWWDTYRSCGIIKCENCGKKEGPEYPGEGAAKTSADGPLSIL